MRLRLFKPLFIQTVQPERITYLLSQLLVEVEVLKNREHLGKGKVVLVLKEAPLTLNTQLNVKL